MPSSSAERGYFMLLLMYDDNALLPWGNLGICSAAVYILLSVLVVF